MRQHASSVRPNDKGDANFVKRVTKEQKIGILALTLSQRQLSRFLADFT
jgi:hypothetical protein